jgi:type I restriction enzyme S subunit
MKNWVTKKLGEVYDVRDGTHDSPKYVKEGYALITSKNLKNDDLNYANVNYITEQDYININKRSKVDIGDVLFAMIGTIGNPIVIKNQPDFAIKNVALFKVPKNQDSYFLKYYLDSGLVIEQMTKDAKGATQKFVGLGYLRSFEIPLPPLPEQQRIVAILDEAFAAIAKALANAEQNLKNTKELFDSYLQGVFENKGEGWEENVLKDICELKSGTTISTSLERTEGDVLYTKVGDMNLPDNEVEINTSSRFVNSKEIKINQIIPEGAIIFPKRGGAIATNKKRKIVKPTIVDLNTMAIIPSKKIDKDYFFHWFQLFDLNSISNGANIPQINNYSFDEVFIPYPKSVKEQQVIVQKLDALSTETKRLESIYQQKINDLEELKKSVLQKAFAGELRGGEPVEPKTEKK